VWEVGVEGLCTGSHPAFLTLSSRAPMASTSRLQSSVRVVRKAPPIPELQGVSGLGGFG
jgi:hypothetical protein